MRIEHYDEISYIKVLNTNMGAHINVYLYLVDGLLIDCGPQSMQAELAPVLLELRPRELFLTHLHEDHCGMAAWVEQNLQIPIYLAEGDLAEAAEDAQYAEYRHLTWGERRGFHALPLGDELKTDHYLFKVIETPGHLKNHRVLFEESRGWLFSGDLYVRRHPRFAAGEENASEMISSLEAVLALPFKTVFCAHAGILENGREKLEEKLDYLRSLRSSVAEMRRSGMTDEEIDHSLFPEEQLITEISGGEWTSLNLIRSL